MRPLAIIPVMLASLALVSSAAAQPCQPEWSGGLSYGGCHGSIGVLQVFDEDGPGPNPPALFAGGQPAECGAVADGIARWDGDRWSPVGQGVTSVSAMASFDDGSGPALYAAGFFKLPNGQNFSGVQRWDGQAWLPLGAGLTQGGRISALASFDPDGTGPEAPALYAGGFFAYIDGIYAKYIARWDGASWSTVAGGANGAVDALTVWDPDDAGPALTVLIAAGEFRTIGGQNAERTAAWDGQKWSTLGGGLSAPVDSLAVYDADGPGPGASALIAAGHFGEAGGQPASAIAQWNGADWSPLGAGLAYYNGPGHVYGLGVFDLDGPGPAGPSLIVGGEFTLAGGVKAYDIAAWDGAAWSAVAPNNYIDRVYALASYTPPGAEAPVLVAAHRAGNGSSLLILDHENWINLGRGLDDYAGSLSALDIDGDGPKPAALIATGAFRSAGGGFVNHIGSWDGASWSGFADGWGFLWDGDAFNDAVAFDPDADGPKPTSLYAAGTFGTDIGYLKRQILRWTGQKWVVAEDGFAGGYGIYDLFVFDDDGPGPHRDALYAAGNIPTLNDAQVNHIARWDGQEWTDVGGGVSWDKYPDNAYILAMEAFDDDGDGPLPPALYIGGFFYKAGGMPAVGLARWDGSTWSAPGDVDFGKDLPSVAALTTFDPDGPGPAPAALYVGGLFTSIGGTQANHIARWDGGSWSPLGSGMWDGQYVNYAPVKALAGFDDGTGPALYAAGEFSRAGDVDAANIARWDGSAWSALGSGLNRLALALAVFDDDGPGPQRPALYAAGQFTQAGGISSGYIARWGCPPPPPCKADCDGSGALDVFDFLCFVNAFNAGEPAADCNADGAMDLFDFLCFTSAFNAGC